MLDEVTIYTDGGLQSVGAWAAILQYKAHMKEICGYEYNAFSANEMELTAAIRALKALKRPCVVTLFSDSQYLVHGMSKYLELWKINSWHGSNGPLKNVGLWQSLDHLNKRHTIYWVWVRAHSGNVLNSRCDQLVHEQYSKAIYK